ncbi:RICIN domain-containing protein [Nonomuraea sp. CA-143628]|uniref:RICIN domain-containing protein n=1 Tax=Nonomuraea sp. CA-143628 TaxID=3239997 RepID=UPI003D8D6020
MKPGEPSAISKAARWIRKAAMVSAGATLAFSAVPALAAHANGKISWKNAQTGNYLEVYYSSLAKGGLVGQWPRNGTSTQYWYDMRLSDRYYVEYNYHSWLLLTAYNSCGNGLTQWPTAKGNVAYTTQEWKERHLDSRYGWALINRAGCSGNARQSILAVNPAKMNLYNVYLYNQDRGPCNLTYILISGNYVCTWH